MNQPLSQDITESRERVSGLQDQITSITVVLTGLRHTDPHHRHLYHSHLKTIGEMVGKITGEHFSLANRLLAERDKAQEIRFVLQKRINKLRGQLKWLAVQEEPTSPPEPPSTTHAEELMKRVYLMRDRGLEVSAILIERMVPMVGAKHSMVGLTQKVSAALVSVAYLVEQIHKGLSEKLEQSREETTDVRIALQTALGKVATPEPEPNPTPESEVDRQPEDPGLPCVHNAFSIDHNGDQERQLLQACLHADDFTITVDIPWAVITAHRLTKRGYIRSLGDKLFSITPSGRDALEAYNRDQPEKLDGTAPEQTDGLHLPHAIQPESDDTD